MAQATLPPWIQTLRDRDPQFAGSYLAHRERILRDRAIPAKSEHLMTRIVDALPSHRRLAAGAGLPVAPPLHLAPFRWVAGTLPNGRTPARAMSDP
jgi:hypothetical protein